MDIGFIWDEDKYEEVQREHNVQFYEVVSAFDDPNGYEIADPTEHEDRWVWVEKQSIIAYWQLSFLMKSCRSTV